MPSASHGSRGRAHSTPNRLIRKWERAARRASADVTTAAKLAVAVVPTFSPNTMASAYSNGISPPPHNTIVKAVIALDDCTRAVSRAPAKANSRAVPAPRPLSPANQSVTAGRPVSEATLLPKIPIASNSSARPQSIRPASRVRFRPSADIPKAGINKAMATDVESNPNPSNTTSQAVTVVPTLAPRIIATACRNPSSRA